LKPQAPFPVLARATGGGAAPGPAPFWGAAGGRQPWQCVAGLV